LREVSGFFAVGDADQSIYAFAGANPDLLESLTRRADVRTIRLRFNYRSGAKIIRASLGALGEERDYHGVDGAPEGDLSFWTVPYGHDSQAQAVADTIIPKLIEQGFDLGQVAVPLSRGVARRQGRSRPQGSRHSLRPN